MSSDGKMWYARQKDVSPRWVLAPPSKFREICDLYAPRNDGDDGVFIVLNDDECIFVNGSTFHYKRMKVEDV